MTLKDKFHGILSVYFSHTVQH